MKRHLSTIIFAAIACLLAVDNFLLRRSKAKLVSIGREMLDTCEAQRGMIDSLHGELRLQHWHETVGNATFLP